MAGENDFDMVIDRRNSGSVKWGRYADPAVLPMWVADMDFKAPPLVVAAVREYAEHGIYGYVNPTEGLVSAVLEMLEARYAWRVEAEWLIWLPGLVSGLNVCCAAIGEKGDGILSPVPIYGPFLTAPRNADREPQIIRTACHEGRWQVLAEDVEAACTERTSLMLLCNPHNPVGRAYTRKELEAYAEICLRHDLVVCSDEIHCDLVLDPVPHLPIASLDKEIAERSITLMAPSKTYNLAGLGCSFAVVPNPELRRRMQATMRGIVPAVNAAGLVAAEAAYRYGEPWRQELLAYLRENRDLLARFVAERLPGVGVNHVEATYLAWLDVTGLPVSDPAVFFEEHGVGLSDGRIFRGNGFLRLNFGCPRSLLLEGLERMQHAVDSL